MDRDSDCDSGRHGATGLALKLIVCYQRYLSHLTPPSCRFYPSCSLYTYQAIERFGLLHGGWLGVKRICRCHPFHAGGVDLVPNGPAEAGGQEPGSEMTVADGVKGIR